MIRSSDAKRRDTQIALGDPMGAARSERAAGRERRQRGDGAGNRNEPRGAFEARSGAEKTLGVGVARAAKNFGDATLLDDTSGVHDGDAIGDLGNDAKIVSDEEKRKLKLPAKPPEKLENLFLHGDVESRGGLVGDQYAGTGGESHGDHHALAKPSGKLVGILAGAKRGVGDGSAPERVKNAASEIGPGDARLVDTDRFFDLESDVQDGIESGHRLLKNHGDATAAKRAQFAGGCGKEICGARGG